MATTDQTETTMNNTNHNKAYSLKLLIALLLTIAAALSAKAQEQSIAQVLQEIELNNPELQKAKYLAEREIAEQSTTNRLSDPRISYAHLWNKDDGKEQVSEMVLSQEFDFPGLYLARAKEIKQKKSASNLRLQAERQRILLEAKELCLDLIALRKQHEIRKQKLSITQELLSKYEQNVEKGQSSILDLRSIQVANLNANSELQILALDIESTLRKLVLFNGAKQFSNMPTDFPKMQSLDSYEGLWQTAERELATLKASDEETRAAQSAVASAKMQGWPKIELGYRRNTEPRVAFNGFVVGLSIPLFSNSNGVKLARAEAKYAEQSKSKLQMDMSVQYMQDYKEAQRLKATLESYDQFQSQDKALELLNKALQAGQINMINYLNGLNQLQELEQNRIDLSSRYHKSVARLFLHKL